MNTVHTNVPYDPGNRDQLLLLLSGGFVMPIYGQRDAIYFHSYALQLMGGHESDPLLKCG